MKVFILGATGMLGHKLAQTLKDRHETYATIRHSTPPANAPARVFDGITIVPELAAEDFDNVYAALRKIDPAVVVNCVGIVKQLAKAQDSIDSITINALLPHKLAQFCKTMNARLITLSTDCVFSGSKGNYLEADKPDPVDLYGRSKLLGEVSSENCLTIRTSMIGRQLIGNHGLVEWLLSENGNTVKGYKKAIFSGFTTNALSDIIADIIDNHPRLSGLQQIAAAPINKFDLLTLLVKTYRLSIKVVADESLICDRSLNGESFRRSTGIHPLDWPVMIDLMKNDPTKYPIPALITHAN